MDPVNEPIVEPTEPTEPVEPEPQDPESTEPKPAEPKSHLVNRNKYDRDIAERDKEIKELKEQLGEAAKSEERAKELSDKITALEQKVSDKELEAELKVAGCKNVKAAKALLDEYETVDALKEGEPYLFDVEKKKIVSSGGAPAGSPTSSEQDSRMRKAMGLKDKE